MLASLGALAEALKPVSAYLDLTVSGLVGEREFAAAAALVPSKRDLVAFLSK